VVGVVDSMALASAADRAATGLLTAPIPAAAAVVEAAGAAEVWRDRHCLPHHERLYTPPLFLRVMATTDVASSKHLSTAAC